MTLAAPLARALEVCDVELTQPPRRGQHTPSAARDATALLAALRADPETVAAIAEALHDMPGGDIADLAEWQADAALLADALFGAP